MTGSAGSAMDVILNAIAFFNRRRVREEVRGDFAGSEGRRIHFCVFFRGSFQTLFSVVFFKRFWVPSGTSFSIKKLEKHRFGTTCGEHGKGVRKRCGF